MLARRISQGLFLALFLFLAVLTVHPLRGGLPVEALLRLDPLANLAPVIAARSLTLGILWALPVTLLTLLAGRAFCGWVCPMGTTLDVLALGGRRGRREDGPAQGVDNEGSRQPQRRTQIPASRLEALRPVKHYLFLTLLFSAFFTSLFFLILDPLSLLSRTLATALYPGLNVVVSATQEWLYGVPPLQAPVLWSDQVLRGTLLPYQPQLFRLGDLMLLVFVGMALLNLAASRFWCRYLCPLASLLGLLSRFSFLKRQVSEACDRCGHCAAQCPNGAISPQNFSSSSNECILCLNCRLICPQEAISYSGLAEGPRHDPSRRQFLGSLGVGALAVVGVRVAPGRAFASPYLVRPPGAQKDDFWARCIRCGQCMKVCPTAVLQPSFLEGGLEGLWTPALVSRQGYCDYSCNACGQVCPTGAIDKLTLAEKRKTIIATAYIDERRCFPWADQRECLVCEEVCPVPEKAIILEKAEMRRTDGTKVVIGRPRVVRSLCIGCGICEYKCPVPNESAIRISTTSRLVSSEKGAIFR